MRFLGVPVLSLVFLMSASAEGAVWFVNKAATGVENGQSWATAYRKIQDAVNAASSDGGGEIWIASGTYNEARASYPHGNDDDPAWNTGSLILVEGIKLYGGFSGTEGALLERDVSTNVTIIDGSISRNGSPAYHVIVAADGTTLDGFTIEGGNANGPADDLRRRAGGILCMATDMTFRNCTFRANRARTNGGAFYSNGSKLDFEYCRFSDNHGSSGGAILNNGAVANLTSCVFDSNRAANGPAIYNGWSSTTTAQNCVFYKNSCSDSAGAIANRDNDVNLTNCTFYGNSGVGGYVGGVISDGPMLTMSNSIIWGNASTKTSNEWVSRGVQNITYTCIQGGWTGIGNISEDPLMMDPENWKFNLQPNSPAIDTALAPAPPIDLIGTPRPQGLHADMGALEFDDQPPSIDLSGPSTNLTRGGPVSYTVTYSDFAQITLTAEDLTLNRTGSANGNVGISGASNSRLITISGITGTGTIGISILEGTASDWVGNLAPSVGPSSAFTVDNTRPQVISITTLNSSPTNEDTLTFDIEFSEEVSGLDVADLQVNHNGTAHTGLQCTPSAGLASSFLATVTGVTGNGNLSLEVLASGTVQDAVGNQLASGGNSGLVLVDNLPPGVSNVTSSVANGNFITGQEVPITINFSEPVSVAGGMPSLALNSGGTAAYVSGSGASTLTFHYGITAGEYSPDLDYSSSSSLDLGGAHIRDLAGNDASVELPSPGGVASLGYNKDIRINVPPVTPFDFAGLYTYNPGNGHVYCLTPSSMLWPAAQEWAQNHSIGGIAIPGNLVTIRSQVENQWIVDTLGTHMYIGFNDIEEEGVWEWVSGEPVVYTNWKATEPNNYGDAEDWGEIDSGTPKWNDINAARVGIVEFVHPYDDGFVDSDSDGVPDEWEDNDVDGIPDGFPIEDSGEGEGESCPENVHSADQDADEMINLTELLRVIQFYNSGGFSCSTPADQTEDGYLPGGTGTHSCCFHHSDYDPHNWRVDLTELLRLIQFFNSGGYTYCPAETTEDGFCPNVVPAPGDTETFLLPGDIPLEMVWIPEGSFLMGRDQSEQDSYSFEDPQHSVTVPGFWMARYELTKGQWMSLMGSTPWSGQDNVLDDPSSPAVYVSWNDAQTFIAALNVHTGQNFRLPSEAEWEYACRAGTSTRFYWGDDPSYAASDAYCWWTFNAWDLNELYAHVVGQKLPNSFGLYDMSGNVWEWVQDWWHVDYTGAPTNGSAWESPAGSSRAARGGSWADLGHNCRSRNRGQSNPSRTIFSIGFRLAK